MAHRQPKEATTRKQLDTIRGFLNERLKFDEHYSKECDASFFDVRADGPTAVTVHLVHRPGTLTMYSVFGVKPGEKRLGEVLRFANLFNQGEAHAALFVRPDGTVVLRASIGYSRVKNLHREYLPSSLIRLMELTDAVDLPLIEIANGATAQQAVDKVWESASPLPIQFSELPQPKAKTKARTKARAKARARAA